MAYLSSLRMPLGKGRGIGVASVRPARSDGRHSSCDSVVANRVHRPFQQSGTSVDTGLPAPLRTHGTWRDRLERPGVTVAHFRAGRLARACVFRGFFVSLIFCGEILFATHGTPRNRSERWQPMAPDETGIAFAVPVSRRCLEPPLIGARTSIGPLAGGGK